MNIKVSKNPIVFLLLFSLLIYSGRYYILIFSLLMITAMILFGNWHINKESIASNILDSLVYDENLSEIKNQIVTDAKLYYKPEKILFALSKMETSVEIVVNDFGEDFSVGILNKVELVNDNLFKLNLKNTFIVGSRKSIKRIYVRIAQLLIKDNENEIITEKLGLVSKKMTIVYNLADLLNSQDTEVAIDGICSLSIRRLSNY